MTPEFNTFGAPLPKAAPRGASLGASEGSQKPYKAAVLGTFRPLGFREFRVSGLPQRYGFNSYCFDFACLRSGHRKNLNKSKQNDVVGSNTNGRTVRSFAQAVHEIPCLRKTISIPPSPEKWDLVGISLGFSWGFVGILLRFCWDWIGVVFGLGWDVVGKVLPPQNSATTANKSLPPSVHCWAHESCQDMFWSFDILRQ